MRYKTELMEQILTNEKAQEIIDYVSQIYGESYVGLWIFQAIGSVLGPVCDLSEQLRYEGNPATSVLLLGYWEREYALEYDPTLTTAQRQNRIVDLIKSRGACTPAKMGDAIAAALGLSSEDVEIVENVSTNKFRVSIKAAVRSLAPAEAVIQRMKPAHLIYEIVGIEKASAQTTAQVGAAITYGIQYNVEVQR